MAFKRKILDGLSGLLQQLQSSMLPSGAIVWFGNRTTAPSGWAICNGTNGTPNLIGRYPLGATSSIGSTVNAGLPNITGTAACVNNVASGAFSVGSYIQQADIYGRWAEIRAYIANFDASKSNSIYGKSSTVTPPSVKLLPCMKL